MDKISLADARDLGLKTYFTGKPCQHGHISERRVSNSTCCECIRIWSLEYALKHRDQVRSTTKSWRVNNPDKVQAYAEANRKIDSLKTREWERNNPAKVLVKTTKRKATKLQAVPKWADQNAILEIYKSAKQLTISTGILHHVDHIVPLRSNLVCGLHWEGNLEPIPATLNVRKKNIYWPDMP